ncbi:MAG: 7-cyano-7-deazaguanine synthase QueC [Nitrospinota bacterium]
MKEKAVVLVSGGVDSAALLAIARSEGVECYALSFDYGQRHRQELRAAARVAESLGAREHRVISFDLRAFGGSSLTADLEVPMDRSPEAMAAEIPPTYVPARNTIFLAFALAWAEVLGASCIYIGVNALDYSGYPDCRPEYIEAFQRMARLATRAGVEREVAVEVRTPLLRKSKREIVECGHRLGVDFALTHSCYDPTPEGLSCGRCDACLLRLKGFREAGIEDPIPYAPAAGREG